MSQVLHSVKADDEDDIGEKQYGEYATGSGEVILPEYVCFNVRFPVAFLVLLSDNDKIDAFFCNLMLFFLERKCLGNIKRINTEKQPADDSCCEQVMAVSLVELLTLDLFGICKKKKDDIYDIVLK